ncbi:hypothetical protein WJX84_010599 [Apatococcus fuscideae]|uniref:RRM domain-containing protein n=1 Tax=Apatococcus fuscideae TaxID=2026836 RepID=A0AAW1ST80_9CHLO
MADRTIYIGNVASDADEYTLRSIFETCGQVTQIRIAGKKGLNTVYCFVEFADASQAYSALAMNGLPDPSRVGRTVYLENVAADIDEQVLAEYFSACGDVVAVRLGEKTVPQQLTIKAWIEFRSQHAARTAREYDQTMLQGSAIRVRSSKTAIHTNGLAPPRLTPNSSPGRPSQSLHNLPLDPSHSPPTLPHPHKGPGT